jgi:hypothetical protein
MIKTTLEFYCDASKTPVNVYLERSLDLKIWTRLAQSTGGTRFSPISGQYAGSILDNYDSWGPPRRLVRVGFDPGNISGFYRLGAEEP